MSTDPKEWYSCHTLKWTAFIQMKNTIKAKVPPVWIWKRHILGLRGVTFTIFTCVVSAIVCNFQLKLSASSSIPNMSKHKYVVVDWGSWGIDVQSSSKIIVPNPFNVSEGNDCSIQRYHFSSTLSVYTWRYTWDKLWMSSVLCLHVVMRWVASDVL